MAWCPGLKKIIPRLRALTGTGKFERTPLHNKEFTKIKDAVRDHIQLGPFDVSKAVHLRMDPSQDGLRYLLSQLLDADKEDSYIWRGSSLPLASKA